MTARAALPIHLEAKQHGVKDVKVLQSVTTCWSAYAAMLSISTTICESRVKGLCSKLLLLPAQLHIYTLHNGVRTLPEATDSDVATGKCTFVSKCHPSLDLNVEVVGG